MDEKIDGSPGDLHQPRDTLSRASRQASSVEKLLVSEERSRVGGVSSGLRSYALCLCDLITELVKESETADAEAFDTILSAVAFAAAELNGVVDELLEL
jgi:hypothetical protein